MQIQGHARADFEDAKWKEMRKLIINAIIHTDMVHHFPMVSKVPCHPPSGIPYLTMHLPFQKI